MQQTKLRRFRVAVGGLSPEAQHCREIEYHLSLTDETGAVVEREEKCLVFDGMLGDPDQLPWLIAYTLRQLLKDESTH